MGQSPIKVLVVDHHEPWYAIILETLKQQPQLKSLDTFPMDWQPFSKRSNSSLTWFCSISGFRSSTDLKPQGELEKFVRRPKSSSSPKTAPPMWCTRPCARARSDMF